MNFIEFTAADFPIAQGLARKLGYGDSTAYTSTSAIPGLYCLPLHAGQSQRVIARTVEFGYVAIEMFDDVEPASEPLTFHRIGNDSNGNPRYVVHFLALNIPSERGLGVSEKYSAAVKRANSIGGRKYHARGFGGGIVFQSYSIEETARHISEVTGRPFTAVKG